MTQDGTESASASRRRMLKWMVLGAVGAAIGVLGLETWARPASSGLDGSSLEKAASASSSSGVGGPSPGQVISASSSPSLFDSPSTSFVTVKVMYFQMPQYVDVQKEYFVLQSPAYLGALIMDITDKHPALSAEWPFMMILVDGNPASAGTPLMNGNEVDLIPAIVGG